MQDLQDSIGDLDPLGIGGGASGGGLFGLGLPGSGSPNSSCSPFAWLPPWIPWGQVGGGGGSGLVSVTNIQKSGKDYDRVSARFSDILNAIDPKCLSFLQSGSTNLSTYVNDLLSNNLVAVANYTTTIAAFTGSAGTTMPAGTAAMVVNDSGAFFSSNFTVDQGQLTGGTARAQVFILLHELGHALGAIGFQPDFGSPSAGKSNDSLINKNCSKTLSQFSAQ